VKVNVRPVCDADTSVGATVVVPEPSAANTVTVGELPIALSVPLAVDFSEVVNVAVPVAAGAVTVSPAVQAPPEVAP
jgi:hypothetical protein